LELALGYRRTVLEVGPLPPWLTLLRWRELLARGQEQYIRFLAA
jgi:hypothetical protein